MFRRLGKLLFRARLAIWTEWQSLKGLVWCQIRKPGFPCRLIRHIRRLATISTGKTLTFLFAHIKRSPYTVSDMFLRFYYIKSHLYSGESLTDFLIPPLSGCAWCPCGKSVLTPTMLTPRGEAFQRCIEKVKGETTESNEEKTKFTNSIRGRDLQQLRLYGTGEKQLKSGTSGE